jgi:hypothetical protein
MTARDRRNVVSSFTVIKGAMIEETHQVFEAWDFGLTKRQNLDRLRDENYIGASSTTWLRDVAKVLNRRFEPGTRDRPLVMLAKKAIPLHEWKPLLLWHLTRDEFLVRDFLQNWLFPAFEGGAYSVRIEELDGYLATIDRRGGVTEHAWSPVTANRVAAGLLKIAVDFDLLQGAQSKHFTSYQLPERSFLYLLHALNDAGLAGRSLIESPDWRMFRMRPADVERELLRLHQYRHISYEVAGSLVQLGLPSASTLDYAEAMVA